MLSRALSLAAVMLLLFGSLAADSALAQVQNLEAGKSPSQIFAGTCNACHKAPRGLLKTVSAGSLQGFLRQHYTTSPEMASLLSTFLVSNGATDARSGGSQSKEGKDANKDAKSEAKLGSQPDRLGHRPRPATSQEAARPDADGLSVQGEAGHPGRNTKRLARPGEGPASDGTTPVQAADERGPDGRKLSAKQKLSKRSKPDSEEVPPKIDAGKEEPAKGETAKEDMPKDETAKVESGMPDSSKPSGESESAKIELPKGTGSGETSIRQADPVSPITSAPPVSVAVSSGSLPEVSAVITAAPPPVPAGPPAPPISR